MSNTPKVSIISPVYNTAEDDLNRCLESLTSQSLENIEMIFVDDCSKNNALEVLRDWEAKDNRVKVLTSEESRGAAVARNRALVAATGEYLGFVDAGDGVDPTFFEVLYLLATQDGRKLDIAKGTINEYTFDGPVMRSNMNDRIRTGGFAEMFTEWTSAIFNHDMIKKNNIAFPLIPKSQHVAFLNRVITAIRSGAITDAVGYNYFRRKGSLDDPKIPMKNFQSALKAVEIMLGELNRDERRPDVYLRRYQLQYSALIEHTATQSREPEGNPLAAEAIIKHFNNCKNITGLAAYVQAIYPALFPSIVNGDTAKIASDYLTQYPSYSAFSKAENGGRSGLTQKMPLDLNGIYTIGKTAEPTATLIGKKQLYLPQGSICNTRAA